MTRAEAEAAQRLVEAPAPTARADAASTEPASEEQLAASARPAAAGSEVAPLAASLAGYLVESSRQATQGADVFGRIVREFAALVAYSGLPGSHRASDAFTREAERMEAKGRAELDRLAAVGLAEEQRLAATSEAAFREAAVEIVDEVVALSIERLAESPKIHRMIRQESSTLLEEFLEEVRLWCAQGDDRAERAARGIFRRGRPRPASAAAGARVPDAAETVLTPSPVAPAAYTEPAGFISRAAALILDAVLVTGAAAAAGYLITATLQALRPGILGHFLPVLPSGLGGFLFLLYFLFSWATLGRTLGMGVIGLKVLTLDGRRVSFWRAVLRYIGYLLSTAFIFIGLLWVMIDDRRLGWLDHIAGTKVVRAALPTSEPAGEALEGHRPDPTGPSIPGH